MTRWPQGHIDGPDAKPTFKYELGTLLQGIDDVYLNTADARYLNYMKNAVDELVTADGAIPTYKPQENELDSILMGRQLLRLYGMTQNKRYLTAATLLYDQLQKQPRTPSGGFWHKQRYPNQMWLDGLYMAEPFYARYASISHQPEKFADIASSFRWSKSICATRSPASCITVGTSRSRSAGPTRRRATRRSSGPGPWVGT